ncbi:P-loop containing nucleoside triphosphate hydrolase protein [Truncatella angustata]|uniref:P-loop containing nucleoside triphosphate hydrolase protein n=1 Tax=Truncatella angustata TaxID=152316 RepID=A0A9P8UVG9_9PEZI|nr:P-loop containing nucleoside triphosphate hydrolase protein [Truncatella angustata]KAH6658972.1 P-loop containing nucleoside triphosphate hydrolase protein [Truncatella angustata]
MDHVEISSFPTRGHPLFQHILVVLNEVLAACKYTQTSEENAMDDDENRSELSGSISYGSGAATPTSLKIHEEFEIPRMNRQFNLPCQSITPHKENPNFIGRSDILDHIYSVLNPDKPGQKPTKQAVFALCGLGGVGKTQVAIRFAMDYISSFQAVLFAHADEPTNLLNDFVRFAVELGLVDLGEPDQLYCCEQLKRWFEETDVPWLLIFDNADNPDSSFLDNFWPRCNSGAILITSRVKTLVAKFGGQVLQPLQEGDAINLLLKLTRMQGTDPSERASYRDKLQHEQREAARQIVYRLGCLPLGIYQAANLIVNDSCLLTDFLSAYDYRDLVSFPESTRIFRNPNEEPYRHTLLNVWSMNFESLSQNSQKLVNVFSFLNPDNIELELLASGAEKASRAGESGWSIIDSTRKLTQQKAGILHSSLMDQNSATKTLSMHRLVQAACQHRMEPENRQKAFEMALSFLHHMWPVAPRNNRHRPDLWPSQARLLPHVLSLCRFYADSQEDTVQLSGTIEFAELLYNASWYNYERGTFEHLEPLLHAAEHYCLRHENCEVVLADIYGAKASVATETNRQDAALQNFQLQYEFLNQAIKKNVIQLPNIRFCFALGGMGNGTQGMGQYKDAEQWYRKCYNAYEGLDGDRKIYGGNLAFCLIWQGKLDEAQEVLNSLIHAAADMEFKTGYIMYPLGNLQIARGELDKAFKTHLYALKVYQQTLSDKHHRTADLCHKLGWHYHARKEYAESVELLNQALAVFEARPTWYRNERARTKYKLGCVLQDMGKVEDGSQLINEAEQIRRDILGPGVSPGDEHHFDELVMFWSR